MEEFADYMDRVERVENEPLTYEEDMESAAQEELLFREEHFIPEDFLPSDWYLF
jgi:hypothetical protein